jgi:hypothetical protein
VDAIEINTEAVLMVNANAAKRGVLCIWTIYDRPTDYPHGHIARRHEAPGGPTDHMLTGELEELRDVMRGAGLVCVCRQEGDEPPIVESWI